MSGTYRQGLAAACLLVSISTILCAPGAVAQDAERVVVQAPPLSPSRHLRIAKDVKDAEYRQQVLALTPLGSSYDEVRAFALREWQYQKWQPNPTYRDNLLKLRQFLAQIGPSYFGIKSRALFLAEPPHIFIADLNYPFTAHDGRQYMYLPFIHRPAFWTKEFQVTVYYILDTHRRLIDAFADGTVVTSPSW